MRFGIHSSEWWGAPRKFNIQQKDRRVSWLELFYDLVYVIAISRITHHLAREINIDSFCEYACMFILIFWGWLNGSLFHDIHGNEGLRTRLMTLWQMMIIAALAITIETPGTNYINITIVLMVMQLFITYLWWSVGIYDKEHRKYNKPFTVLYLISLGLMGLSLAVSESWLRFIIPLVLICNYAPSFVSHYLLKRSSLGLDLSPSMFERLGLFTIIVFGEVVLGVISGISETQLLNFSAWVNFALALALIFSLWWIFFTLISNREAKKGLLNATLLELLYVPALISLGLIAAGFTSLLSANPNPGLQSLFSYAIGGFLISINLMGRLIVVPEYLQQIRRPFSISILVTAIVFVLAAAIGINFPIIYYLLAVLIILLVEILYLNSLYYNLNLD